MNIIDRTITAPGLVTTNANILNVSIAPSIIMNIAATNKTKPSMIRIIVGFFLQTRENSSISKSIKSFTLTESSFLIILLYI